MHRLNPLFAQVYVTAAILAFVATFLPLWSSHSVDEFATMSLWDGAAIDNHGGGIARLGLILALVLVVVLMLSAVFVDVPPVLPGVAAVLCIPAIVLLLTKPYSSTPKPDLGAGGAVLLGLTIVVMVTAIGHIVARVVNGPVPAVRPATPVPLPPR